MAHKYVYMWIKSSFYFTCQFCKIVLGSTIIQRFLSYKSFLGSTIPLEFQLASILIFSNSPMIQSFKDNLWCIKAFLRGFELLSSFCVNFLKIKIICLNFKTFFWKQPFLFSRVAYLQSPSYSWVFLLVLILEGGLLGIQF